MTPERHGAFLIPSHPPSQPENTMNKSTSAKKPSGIVEPSADPATPSANTDIPAIILAKFWLLAEGTAKKLGLRSTGCLSYQVLADHDRNNLFIALTANFSGGFFSKERVNMLSIEACLATHKAGEPFPSKALKDAFRSRSSNNAGFMSACMRALTLTAAAPDAESKHIVAGDWDAWRKEMIAEPGTLIELPADADDEKQAEPDRLPDHKEHKKTLGIPAKKLQ
jgi:hypothetical protein